ncbi:fungal-specific transcription factor domain-containing protein [Mycena belliarum]|uniref:Fungal-specific transcription factor domain-containing protein n=1 Tax=Mycena belliarum TaxID=1033014 RepID=A0AAD6UCD6_9AGAR|nr:fungal-specific transcription factor domain-containing protein [Mycena belliae]
MSTAENGLVAKRRKGHRPCDICRRKKRRCDGKDPCAFCVQRELSCTYQDRTVNRSRNSYVQSIGGRLQTVESMLQSNGPSSSPASYAGPAVELATCAIRRLNDPFPAPHSDDLTFLELSDNLQALSLNNHGDCGFQGKSSQAMLVKAAMDLKSSYGLPRTSVRLPTTWRIKQWEDERPAQSPHFNFPPDDLMRTLLGLYFEHINLMIPLLHRPTFERAVAAGMHLRDAGFGGTVLLVCAVGARYQTDGPSGSAGWEWFDQVELAGNPLRGQPTLYDLQCYCLSVEFLERASGPRACWTLVGFAIRLGQDIGAHRMKMNMRAPTPEEELEKRAYWILVLFDTHLSGALGRSIAIHSSEFDLAPPIMCDDEYWEADAGRPAFTQPADTPSHVDFFACQLSLGKILAYALRILYSTNRSKTLMGLRDPGWEAKIVIEFDSALNVWFDSIPAHLRWDPAGPADVFFDQAAALHCSYYLAQILIHRPFIPAVRRSAGASEPTPFPSLAICNNAARACANVAEIQQRRRPRHPLLFAQTAAFTSGIVLLLNIWGAHRTGVGVDADLSDVHRCTRVLRASKAYWPSAGHLLDTLEQLVKLHDVPPAPSRHGAAVHDPSPFVPSEEPRDHLEDTAPPAWSSYAALGSNMVDRVENFGELPARPPRATDFSAAGAFPETLDGTRFDEAPAVEIPVFAASQAYDVPYASYANANGSTNETTYGDFARETAEIWSAAPNAFEVSDWDMYLSSLADAMGTDQSIPSQV